MASDLISKSKAVELVKFYEGQCDGIFHATEELGRMPTVDAVEVVHGEWITKCMEGSWTHYRYSCSNCGSGFDSNSNYCPNCGADMRVGRWKGEGMGDYSCSLCGEVVNGNHREECPNCHAKMDGGDKG